MLPDTDADWERWLSYVEKTPAKIIVFTSVGVPKHAECCLADAENVATGAS